MTPISRLRLLGFTWVKIPIFTDKFNVKFVKFAANTISLIKTKNYKRKSAANNDTDIRNSAFVVVKQEWDYERPCTHCDCIHLKKS